MERIWKGDLVALVPIYSKDLGNVCQAYLYDTSFIIKKPIKSVVRSICRYYMLDLNSLRDHYQDLIGGKNLMPLALSRTNILVPVKLREVLGRNDGAFGYINLKHIKRVASQEGSTTLTLNNNIVLRSRSSEKTVRNHINRANIISRCYLDPREKLWLDDINLPVSQKDLRVLEEDLKYLISKL